MPAAAAMSMRRALQSMTAGLVFTGLFAGTAAVDARYQSSGSAAEREHLEELTFVGPDAAIVRFCLHSTTIAPFSMFIPHAKAMSPAFAGVNSITTG